MMGLIGHLLMISGYLFEGKTKYWSGRIIVAAMMIFYAGQISYIFPLHHKHSYRYAFATAHTLDPSCRRIRF
jgi:hypothetical protein